MKSRTIPLAILALMVVAPSGLAHPANRWRPLNCRFNYFTVGEFCSIRMRSQSVTLLKMKTPCHSVRGFSAVDRSRRVSLYAEGHWIAPRLMRIRAVGGPLGPLWVKIRFLGAGKLRVVNLSRFGVLVSFTARCVYPD